METRKVDLRAILGDLRAELLQAEKRAFKLRSAIQNISDVIGDSPYGDADLTQGDLMGLLSKSANPDEHEDRPTMIEVAYRFLLDAGRPMHINQIVEAVRQAGFGNGNPKKVRLSLVGSMDRKWKRGESFVKVAPATYTVRRFMEGGS